ncbi:Hypothetical predicted protein [Cloeon dipterum]|uniref:separase n=1 Tax=Cloeon dipterum TaxID=197152 RepID=A0A8S1BJA6_9INSE|nr:Hypothetical predicted protein [Cloeon dipterum]
MHEEGGSKNKEKLAEMLMKNVDDTLDKLPHQGMAYGTLYETLNKQKAILQFHTSGSSDKSSAYLVESAGVSARKLFCSRRSEANLPIIDGRTASVDGIPDKQENQDENLINFSMNPLEFRARLKDLPSDCVIVQLSEIYPGQRPFDPPNVQTRPLHLARYCCGENYMDQCVQELKAVVQENVEQISAAVQDWLGPWRCLLLGQIASSKVSSSWNKTIRKLADELNIEEENISKFSMLAQCSNVLKKVDLVHGLQAIVPKTVKNMVEFVSNTAKLVKEYSQEFFGLDMLKLNEVQRHPVILIVDNNIFAVPWEQLDIVQVHPMSRMPCLALVHAMFKAPNTNRELDPGSAFFVLDPDKNLPCASKLKPLFDARNAWKGIVGEAPERTEMEKHLQDDDIYIYCGHGSGSHLVHNYDHMNLNAAAMLMGCSSADLYRRGVHWEMSGAPLNFILSGSPICLGTLWTVTDSDTNRITVRLLETWLPPKEKDSRYRMELCSQDLSFAKVFEDVLPQKGLLGALRSAHICEAIALVITANLFPRVVLKGITHA